MEETKVDLKPFDGPKEIAAVQLIDANGKTLPPVHFRQPKVIAPDESIEAVDITLKITYKPKTLRERISLRH